MIKKTISYTDYEGKNRTEDFYFNLSKAELTEMELSEKGGFEKYLEQIMKTEDNKELVRLFKEIILKSYGEKSLDGKRFIKSKELSEAFSQTEAYVELYMELVTDTDKAIEFCNGLMPSQIGDKITKEEVLKIVNKETPQENVENNNT